MKCIMKDKMFRFGLVAVLALAPKEMLYADTATVNDMDLEEITTISEDVNWVELVAKANKEAKSEWNKSDSALERDLKNNLEKSGNIGEPLMIKSDSIFYRVYYTEQMFDLLNSLDNLKERLSEVFLYTKPYSSVETLFKLMAQYQRKLYVILISRDENRSRVISFSPNEYMLFGSKAK